MSQVIEFMGIPRAGKTTQIAMLAQSIRERGKTCAVITDRDINKELSFVSKWLGLEYNMLYVNKILEKILFHKHNNIDVIIVDRGFIDMKPWIDVELELDHIEGEEAKMLNSFCDSMAAKYVDHALLFMIDPHKALERHRMTTEGTIKKVSYSMNDDYLPRLYSAYEKLVHPKNRITIDGEIDVHQTHENIMKALHTSI